MISKQYVEILKKWHGSQYMRNIPAPDRLFDITITLFQHGNLFFAYFFKETMTEILRRSQGCFPSFDLT